MSTFFSLFPPPPPPFLPLILCLVVNLVSIVLCFISCYAFVSLASHIESLHASPLDLPLPLEHMVLEADEEDGPAGPDVRAVVVCADAGLEAGAVADALDDAGHEGGAVELAHLPRHRDGGVGERAVVDDHVLARVAGGLFERVGRAGEEEWVQTGGEEGKEGKDPQGPGRGGGGVAAAAAAATAAAGGSGAVED
jgi:hypothetical protein